MAMVVKNNMSAVNTLNTLNKNQSLLGKSLQKVSSGMKINSAQDDASGYAISERMRVMIRSLDQANQNTQNGSSLMKVAEGAVSNTVEILKTLKEKAINAATDTNTEEDRAIIQKEITQLVDQVDDNALITFNGKYLLDGSKSAAGNATYNAWTNQSLAEDTSALTKLTDLQARDGEKLTIESTDKVTVSYVQNGKTYVTTSLVGDMTLGGVFNLAEKIDQSGKTFATSANEAVSKSAGLITVASSKDTVDKAVAYLQDALSYDKTAYNAITDVAVGASYLTVTVETDATKLPTATLDVVAGSNFSDLNDPLFTLELQSATGINETYNGEIFAKVKETFDNYNTIVNKMGNANSGMGLLLKNQLSSELSITWDGSEGNIYQYKDDIYKKGTSELINYYEQYTSAAADKNSAEKAMSSAVKSYNEGLAQLDALVKFQAFQTDESTYKTNVDSFIESLRTEMSGKQEGIYTLAAGTAGNAKALSFDAGNSLLSDSERAATIENIVSAVKDKLYDLMAEAELNLDDLSTASAKGSAFYTAVKALIGDDTPAIASAGLTYTKESAVLGTKSDGTAAGSASSFLAAIATAVKKMEGTSGSAKAVTDYRKYLDLAQNEVLAQYSGPALLTGAEVGLDPAGKIVTTLDGKAGLTFTAATAGADGQISGFTISISDSDGNVRKSVNTSLNAWSTTIYGKNASEKDNSLAFQIGAAANQTITVDMADMRAEAIGLKGKDGKVVDVSTKENANAAISVFENALQKALDVQTTIGAIEARLEYTASNLTTSTENVQAAESTIRDADMAKEMTNYTKNNVLLQAAQSMLAQANQNSSAVLSLLQ